MQSNTFGRKNTFFAENLTIYFCKYAENLTIFMVLPKISLFIFVIMPKISLSLWFCQNLKLYLTIDH